MPSPLPRQVRWNGFAHYCSIDVGLPQLHGGSAPALIVSRPAQRSLTLWPARSPSRLATLYTESSDRFVTSAVVSVATGWSEPVPGRELHPLKSSAFSRRTCNPDLSTMHRSAADSGHQSYSFSHQCNGLAAYPFIMPNRIEAGETKASPNRHREAKATAPVLDSTRHCTHRPGRGKTDPSSRQERVRKTPENPHMTDKT